MKPSVAAAKHPTQPIVPSPTDSDRSAAVRAKQARPQDAHEAGSQGGETVADRKLNKHA